MDAAAHTLILASHLDADVEALTATDGTFVPVIDAEHHVAGNTVHFHLVRAHPSELLTGLSARPFPLDGAGTGEIDTPGLLLRRLAPARRRTPRRDRPAHRPDRSVTDPSSPLP